MKSQFLKSIPKDRSVKLDREFYSHVKPGLSSFADDPKKGAQTIKELLDKAKNVVPQPLWHQVSHFRSTMSLYLLRNSFSGISDALGVESHGWATPFARREGGSDPGRSSEGF